MLTWDEVREAFTSAVPSAELHRLIERELDAYRTVKEIQSDLVSFNDSIMNLPNYSEELEVDYMGSISALIGWCRKDQVYHTKTRPVETPAITEIAESISQQLSTLPVQNQRAVLTHLLSRLPAADTAAA